MSQTGQDCSEKRAFIGMRVDAEVVRIGRIQTKEGGPMAAFFVLPIEIKNRLQPGRL